MPAYKAAFFAQALDSVLAQTYTALELVICDDNADGAIEVVLASRLLVAPFIVRYQQPAKHWLLGAYRFSARRTRSRLAAHQLGKSPF
ncbi:glycosyltransferase family A protein [Xanthomonas campestris pv. raphani]|nr:glycosyltransferase family A protein [Xanthomonas campestris]AEL07082.1 O-antigen biosynthesis protein [Xanthomonas campestris pv. raphani 756C]MEA9658653.1 glycosyltransferase family A protein [Xanthomonas campestris pv. raphani]MEA9676881.1 glycosyltransferase family A protein [Xanthomonas campestris pv. raphani]MEA9755670.1 glycosyltransferase family A protein [Xanthomonas campestris pv. raphani]MEA9762279.1 glycosyltransferase family A protein [Xanthomonas campestris pv. raphani]